MKQTVTVTLTVEQVKDLIFDCDWALRVSPNSPLAATVRELQKALDSAGQYELKAS